MLYVHRVLHPVGEGAFFTEQFYDEKKSCVFSVVYDCGSIHKQKDVLFPQIEEAFTDKEIDLMFISHFDEDHVKGIKKLCDNKDKRLTGNSKVYIPFIIPLEELNNPTDDDKKEYVSYYKEIFNILTTSGVKIIPVVPNMPSFSDFSDSKDNVQISGRPIVLPQNIIWEYIPFNVSGDYYKEFIDKVLEHNKTHKDDQVLIKNLFDPKEVCKHKGVLRNIYNSIGQPVGVVTSINVNSLLVLSKAENPRMVESVMFIGGKLPVLPFGFTFHFDYLYHRICNESCLYTGDCTLKNDDCWGKLVSQLKDCNISEIGLFQIPHHGSPNNYNKAILHDKAFTIDAGFVNCCLTKGHAHFEYNIIEDFWKNYKPLFLVTEDPVSKIHFIITLDESARASDDNQQTPITTE